MVKGCGEWWQGGDFLDSGTKEEVLGVVDSIWELEAWQSSPGKELGWGRIRGRVTRVRGF